MSDWLSRIEAIEELEDAAFDPALVAEMARAAAQTTGRSIRFSTPTFKEYDSTEVKGCGKNSFPAFSITAGGCALDCDHCQAEDPRTDDPGHQARDARPEGARPDPSAGLAGLSAVRRLEPAQRDPL